MNICIVIQDTTLNEIKVKKLTEETIYKKCNYKNNTDFMKLKSWNYDSNIIELWGKNKSNYNNTKSDYILFKNNNIDVYGKSIFIMKNDDNKYLSLDTKIFTEFFSINENNEQVDLSTHTQEENEELDEDKELDEDEDEDEDEDNEDDQEEEEEDEDNYFSDNSELSYDAYCYSDEENK